MVDYYWSDYRELRGAGIVKQVTNNGTDRLEMSTEYFMIPPNSSSLADPPDYAAVTSISVFKSPLPFRNSLLRREIWVPPLLVLSSLTMILIILFEIFVLCKTWRTVPSRRHLFLGQMLLSGLFICAVISAVLTVEPTINTCGIVRFGIGFGYSLVFSTLLVKCVFLISLNGGVYLPATYQALLLFFAVAIQVAIDVQWLIHSPPKLLQGEVTYQTCQTPYIHILYSLAYSAFLLCLVAILALKSRSIRDNYREAMFIAIAACCVVPVWIGWSVSGFLALEKNRDACLAFGLSITSIIVFLVMFMPKGRQLAAMGREGMYLEDREEKFSTLSRGASPSFFHFKPAAKQAYSHTKPSAINTFGDRVALVAPPPMYAHHYYPCCYYPQPHAHVRNPTAANGMVDANMYTTVEPLYSTNPNVFFHRGLNAGMMY